MLVHPVIAESYATALGDAVLGGSRDPDLPSAALDRADLLQRFAVVSDGRSDQGRDHPVAVVLTLCAAAVLAGMRSFTAIAGWVADVPTELLGQLHDRTPGCPSRTTLPSKTTLWRVLTGADATAVDAAVGAWLSAQATARQTTTDHLTQGEQRNEPAESALVAVAVDGKTVRAAIDSQGNQVHLLPPPPVNEVQPEQTTSLTPTDSPSDDELTQRLREWADQEGSVPSRERIRVKYGIGTKRADRLRTAVLTQSDPGLTPTDPDLALTAGGAR